ncbi:MAG TPA: hypothetical protein VH134_17940 [Candidatus Dormibacteraeota bacterium]|jgi:hypothetical protein|nr:hypothetical protein [Candidatus Dormibacteraeota bacterium]
MRPARTLLVLAALVASVVGCAGCGSTPPATSSPTPTATPSGPRPASPAQISITSPVNGSTVTGTMIHVVVDLKNATVVQATSSNIKPTEGHVHLYIDGNLQYMAYTLSQDFPVHPGTYTIKAEFVASDHFPFSPRVYSQPIVFTVK